MKNELLNKLTDKYKEFITIKVDVAFGGPGSGRTSEGGGSSADTGGSSGGGLKEQQTNITDKDEIAKIMSEPKKPMEKIDKSPNGKTSDGKPLREYSKKEIQDAIESHMKTPVEIYGPKNKRGDLPNEIEYVGRERATQSAISTMTGSWLSPNDCKDFLKGHLSITKGGTTFAIKGSKVV